MNKFKEYMKIHIWDMKYDYIDKYISENIVLINVLQDEKEDLILNNFE